MGEVVNRLNVQFERMKRLVLSDMLDKCTLEQQELFGRIFPAKEVPSAKLDSAIDLVERTLRKHETKS